MVMGWLLEFRKTREGYDVMPKAWVNSTLE
jgi:hypothetical protein